MLETKKLSMYTFKYLLIIFLGGLFFSCGSNSGKNKSAFSIKTNANKGDISNNKALLLSIEAKKKQIIDSVSYTLNGIKVSENIQLDDFRLGKQTIEATVYFNNEKETVNTTVTILNSTPSKSL